jgi:hypothetical protein
MPPPMIGGYVTGPVPITRSGSLVIVARQVLAFPAGVEVEVEAHARGSRAGTAPVPADLPGHPPLKLHVRFADGREAAQDDETGCTAGAPCWWPRAPRPAQADRMTLRTYA